MASLLASHEIVKLVILCSCLFVCIDECITTSFCKCHLRYYFGLDSWPWIKRTLETESRRPNSCFDVSARRQTFVLLFFQWLNKIERKKPQQYLSHMFVKKQTAPFCFLLTLFVQTRPLQNLIINFIFRHHNIICDAKRIFLPLFCL